MATREQIEQIAALMQNTQPTCLFRHVDQAKMGVGAVMHVVSQSPVPVTAGMIAEYMGVSTARVAVLLKKMEAKGLVVREKDSVDGRVTIVRLSELGEKTDAFLKRSIYHRIGEVIDRVGMDRLLEFISVAGEIRELFPETEKTRRK